MLKILLSQVVMVELTRMESKVAVLLSLIGSFIFFQPLHSRITTPFVGVYSMYSMMLSTVTDESELREYNYQAPIIEAF